MISVIVAVYNVEDYIRDCIESIIYQINIRDNKVSNLQKDLAIELILIDDGSTDNSGKICDDYKERYNNSRRENDICREIVVIHQENMGLSSARNKGIDSSYGEYILFVNGDDVVSQDFCSVLWNNLLTADSDISIVNKKDIDESFRFERKDLNIRINNKVQSKSDFIVFDNKQALGQLYGKLHFRMVQVTGVLYKKELFDDIRFPFGKCHEDEFVSYKLLAKAKQIVYEDSQIYYRRIRPNNIISGGYSISNLDILEACRQRKEFFVEKGWSDLYTYAEYDYLKIIMDAFCLIDNDTQTLRYTINYIKKQLYLEWKNEFNLHKNDIKKIISFKQCIMLKIFRCNPVFYKKLYMTNQ